MINLFAKVAVKKLVAQVATVPKAIGGKMQVKRVKPTYEEQTIRPDEDYDGLSAVIVEPKPRPPLESFCTDVIANHIVVNADFAPGGIFEEYIPIMYSYNGAVLPEIPPSGYESCPYLMILRLMDSGSVYLYGSTSKPYYNLKDSVNRLELPSGRNRSLYNADINLWGEVNSSANATYCQLVDKWEILWSNFDIPNGSATATEIYFEGTQPVLV